MQQHKWEKVRFEQHDRCTHYGCEWRRFENGVFFNPRLRHSVQTEPECGEVKAPATDAPLLERVKHFENTVGDRIKGQEPQYGPETVGELQDLVTELTSAVADLSALLAESLEKS